MEGDCDCKERRKQLVFNCLKPTSTAAEAQGTSEYLQVPLMVK